MGKNIYVAKSGNNKSNGSASNPLLTISKAAELARPGDTVIVHGGEYREWVKPRWGGLTDCSRITYMAAPGEKVVIKGSEVIKDWEKVDGTVWKVVVPNSLFGDFNPYIEVIEGDWFLDPDPREWQLHAGDVYLNGKSFYEAKSLDEVKNPVKRLDGFNAPWTKKREPILHPEDTIYQWYAEVDDENTTIYANFHESDPTKELVEINVRKCCFYPDSIGKNYITVSGFEMCHAATTWAPPTGDQPGLIGPHWSKGWIIENNIIHDAKCSAISIGKEASTGDNLRTKTNRKPGYQYQMEAVFRALQIGWSKETIGSHIIRNNVIYDCGQNAVVGHLGCIFCEIYDNHIYNIAIKHEYYGYEIAGIKLHAAIDTQIYNNHIHHCTLGLWLDWQAQGTRVSRNLFYANNRDLFIEVTHGPHIVDNNILGSDYSFDNVAQGGAYINNLICGTMRKIPILDRSTPYHYPHSTAPLSTAFVYGGDDRWFNNIFIGGTKTYTEESRNGTDYYNGYPASMEEYIERVVAFGIGDHEDFKAVLQAVYINNNGYLKGAPAYDREVSNFLSDVDPEVKIVEESGKVYLEIIIEKGLLDLPAVVLETKDLGETRIVEAPFDDPDGKAIVFDVDFFGEKRTEGMARIGPFAGLKEGFNRILVWEEKNG